MKAITFLEGSALPVLINNYKSNIPEGYSERVDYVANIIKQINDAVKKIKLEEVNLVSKRRTLEALSAEAETMIREEMSSEGMCEMQGVYIKYTLSPSPHRLVIEDEKLIPNEYKRDIVTTEIRKDAIKDELKLGTIIPGARLEQGTTLKLTANK